MIQRLGSLPVTSSGIWSATQISRTHARWPYSAILTPALTSFYFPFRLRGKNEFLNLVRSNEDMGKDYIIELRRPPLKKLGMLVHSQWSYPRMPSPMPC